MDNVLQGNFFSKRSTSKADATPSAWHYIYNANNHSEVKLIHFLSDQLALTEKSEVSQRLLLKSLQMSDFKILPLICCIQKVIFTQPVSIATIANKLWQGLFKYLNICFLLCFVFWETAWISWANKGRLMTLSIRLFHNKTEP